MKKGIMGIITALFVVSVVLGGCSKPEEKKTEAPPAIKQTVQEKAAPVGGYGAKPPPAGGYGTPPPPVGGYGAALPTKEQAVETAKEMGEQAMEQAGEQLKEEAIEAVEEAAEDVMKEKAATEGMKLPGKY